MEDLQRQLPVSLKPTSPNRDVPKQNGDGAVSSNGVVMRVERRRQRKKRLSIINGHIYNTEVRRHIPDICNGAFFVDKPLFLRNS